MRFENDEHATAAHSVRIHCARSSVTRALYYNKEVVASSKRDGKTSGAKPTGRANFKGE
jgi:hypothetical protein